MNKTDVLIVGAGPAGIFTAIEMIKKGTTKKIVIVEKGKAIEHRSCPKIKTKQCMNCKPYCHITTGFSGAGDIPRTATTAWSWPSRSRTTPTCSRRAA